MPEQPEPVRAHGERITWGHLPAAVRGWVETEQGPVVEVAPQQGGFSPGTADRVRSVGGRTAFVKAVGEQLNPHTPDLIAREISVLRDLPESARAPRLLSSFDQVVEGNRWVALLVEDIPGRHPLTPWRHAEVEAALEALGALVAQPLPADIALPGLDEDLAQDLGCWPAVRAQPPADLDPWVEDSAERLAALAATAPARLAGDHLVHVDIRSDNLLVTDAGEVRVVDWPWACRGAAWFDTLTLLLNVRVHGGPDVAAYSPHLSGLGATDDDVDAVLAGLLGYFVHAARLPPPAGLPTVRAFQRAQGVAVAAWLRERWGS